MAQQEYSCQYQNNPSEIIPVSSRDSRIYLNIPARYTACVSVSANIRKYRRAADLTQIELSLRLKIGQGAVSKWETGESEPSATSLPRIARVLGINLNQLLKGIDAEYDANCDLIGHSGDQSSDRQGGRSDVAASSRVQQLDQRVREQEELIVRLEAAARGLVAMFTPTSKNRRTPSSEPRSRRTGRKAG